MTNNIILYTTDDGKAQVELYEFDESLYLAQNVIAELFATSKSSISEHIANILKDGELRENSVVRNFRTTESLSSSPSSNICFICSLIFDLLH